MDGGYIPNQVSPLLFTENMAEALEEKVVRLPKDYYVILRFWCYCNIQQCWNFSICQRKGSSLENVFEKKDSIAIFSYETAHKIETLVLNSPWNFENVGQS